MNAVLTQSLVGKRGFDRNRTAGATVSRETWQDLWQRFSFEGLLKMHRRSGWFEDRTDEQLADQLVQWSVEAGYDPVSGTLGWLDEETGIFRPESDLQ